MTPNIELKSKLAGRFKFVAQRPDGSRRLLADWNQNLILDSGLNRMGTGSIYDSCQVGTGSTPPANSDTGLQTLVAGTSTLHAQLESVAPSSPYYGYIQRTFRYAAGAAAGNLSEVGVGWGLSGATLFSRALIKDSGGIPTTITVLSDEILDVSYELRNYAPLSDSSSFTRVIAGVTYTFVIRSANVTSISYWTPGNVAVGFRFPGAYLVMVHNGSLGAITALPGGSSNNASIITNAAYSNNSLQRDFTATWNLDTGNLAGGITALQVNTTIGCFQLSVSPPIPKTAAQQLTLTFRVSWDRYP